MESSLKVARKNPWVIDLGGGYPDSDDEDDAPKPDDDENNKSQAPSGLHDKRDDQVQGQNIATNQSLSAHASLPAGHQGDNVQSENSHNPLVAGPTFNSGFHAHETGELRSQHQGLESALAGRTVKSAKIQMELPTRSSKTPRSEDDTPPEDSPNSKRARFSMFGSVQDDDDSADGTVPAQLVGAESLPNLGPQANGDVDEDLEAFLNSPPGRQHDSQLLNEPITPGIQDGMSTLTLNQEYEYEFGEASGQPNSYGHLLTDSEAESSAYERFERFKRQAAYDLRTNIDRENLGHGGSWVDKDRSGDYDPEVEAKKEREQRSKARGRRKKGKQAKAEEAVPRKLIVRLAFKRIPFGNVQNIVDNEENWPDGWSDVDSEEERERRRRAEESARERALLRPPPPTNQTPILDPAGLLDDITGHPFARGCRSCRFEGNDCSMVSGGSWPCTMCRDFEQDCELIITPRIKIKCNNCADNCEADEENVCSFEMANIGPQEICSQCAAQGLANCFGGIPDDYSAREIDLDSIAYGPGRQHVNCTNCRATKKRCSVKSKDAKGPCKQCKKAGIGCVFYDPPTQAYPLKKGKGKADPKIQAGPSRSVGRTNGGLPHMSSPDADIFNIDSDLDEPEMQRSPSPTPPIVMEDAEGNRGVVVEMRTSYAHPILFNVHDTTECNFCKLGLYGLIGDCEIKCHALQWFNGLGYTELHGGHRETKDPTVMCSSCTANRLQIMFCPNNHDIRPFGGSAPDFETLAIGLCRAKNDSEGTEESLQLWCSLCTTPASFKCVTAQPSLASDEAWIDGCGLRLCGQCERGLREKYHGCVYGMALAYDKELKTKEEDGGMQSGKPRADVGFLKSDGLLMNYMNALGYDPDPVSGDVEMG